MAMLVNVEDLYGTASLIYHYFYNSLLDSSIESTDYRDNIIIRRNLGSSGVFKPDNSILHVDSTIFVYDMDRHDIRKKLSKSLFGYITTNYNILHPDILKYELNEVKKHTDSDVRLCPVSFCAESMCLYLLNNQNMDFSVLFNKENTAHMHTIMLENDLIKMNPFNIDSTKWGIRSSDNKPFIKTKNVGLFTSDFSDLQSIFNLILNSGYAKYVRHLFEWLNSKDITNINCLLSIDEAINLQEDYYNDFLKFVNSNSCSIFTYNGFSYDSSKEY